MAYATLAELKLRMNQASTANDAVLQQMLDSMSALIDLELSGAGVVFGQASVVTATIFGDGTDYLELPAYTPGTLSSVTAPAGYTVPPYVEVDGLLVVVGTDGRMRSAYRDPWYGTYSDAYQGWLKGVPYTATALFGYPSMSTQVKSVLKEANLELAVRTWRAREAGYSDVVGVEGAGAVTISKSYPLLVAKVLAAVKNASPSSVSSRAGVW